jgi:hypothetical protein
VRWMATGGSRRGAERPSRDRLKTRGGTNIERTGTDDDGGGVDGSPEDSGTKVSLNLEEG